MAKSTLYIKNTFFMNLKPDLFLFYEGYRGRMDKVSVDEIEIFAIKINTINLLNEKWI